MAYNNSKQEQVVPRQFITLTALPSVCPKTYICTFRTHRISKARRDFAQEGFLARTVFGTAGVAVTAALSSIQDLRHSDFPWLALSRAFDNV